MSLWSILLVYMTELSAGKNMLTGLPCCSGVFQQSPLRVHLLCSQLGTHMMLLVSLGCASLVWPCPLCGHRVAE